MGKLLLKDELVRRGLCGNADEALRMVIAGEVLVDDVCAKSASEKVLPNSDIRVKAKPGKYVSRGGEKLICAIENFNVCVRGKRCLDIGSSTGGFTDCLLQEGAASVACVDVGYGQLAWKLRQDERVSVYERTNIRHATCESLGGPFDIVVIDVSFIGLSMLAADIARFVHEESVLLALVKPQFESKRGETKNGVVLDNSVRLRTVDEVKDALERVGFSVLGCVRSPIRGRSGNIEFMLYAKFQLPFTH